MKRLLSWILALLLLGSVTALPAQAAWNTPLSAFTYTLDKENRQIVLDQYIGKSAHVAVPGSYRVDGRDYPVILGAKVFASNKTIVSVTLEQGVGFGQASGKGLFYNCSALKSADLSGADVSRVTDLSFLFYGCTALGKVNVTGWQTQNVTTLRAMFYNCRKLTQMIGYEHWNTAKVEDISYLFHYTSLLQTVDLQRWDLSKLRNSGWCFQNSGASQILLPKNMAVISAGFFNHVDNYQGAAFTVPVGVKQIGYAHTFYDFGTGDFQEFQVERGNTAFRTEDGVLYSADGAKLLAVPRGKTFADQTFVVPEGVQFMGELSFSRNYQIKTLVLPNSFRLRNVPAKDAAYILYEDTGNLNAGSNLHIAIYVYTNIQAFAVKPDHPEYTSRNGVLYNKDNTALVCVPTSYAGFLEIPEGVSQWREGAMWAVNSEAADRRMANCSGVYIPQSMTEIAQDQLEKLNRLNRMSPEFSIKIHEDNPAYRVDRWGDVVERIDIAKGQIHLEQDVFTYDAQEKKPMPTVVLDGKKLIPGVDYTTEYMSNTNAGTARALLRGIGIYGGSRELTFTIEKAVPEYEIPQPMTAVYGDRYADVTLPEGFTWEEPEAKVPDAGNHTGYVRYTKDPDNYAVIEKIPVCLTVMPKTICPDMSRIQARYTYTGQQICPEVVITDGDAAVPETEYVLEYLNCTDVGAATVRITDRPGGNYTVAGEQSFVITPKQLKLKITVPPRFYNKTADAAYRAALLEAAPGDDVALQELVPAVFENEKSGMGKPVRFEREFVLTGQDAGNYTLMQPVSVTGWIVSPVWTGIIVLVLAAFTVFWILLAKKKRVR